MIVDKVHYLLKHKLNRLWLQFLSLSLHHRLVRTREVQFPSLFVA